jgi:DNA-binding transcriptional LysR family regulator
MNHKLVLDHLEKLLTLVPIARHGSLKAAAQELRIAQPSLSIKISQLEEILGIQLLHRMPRGVQLTQKGQEVLDFIREVTRKSEDLAMRLSQESHQLEGTLKIGIYDSIARFFWPDFFRRFSKDHPGIKIILSTGRSKDLTQQLKAQNIDICLTVGEDMFPEITTIDLYEDSFSFFVSPNLLKKMKIVPSDSGTIKESDFMKIDLFLFSGAHSFEVTPILRALSNNHDEQLTYHYIDNFEIALEFALQELGIAALPNRVAQRDWANRRLVKINIQGVSKATKNFSPHIIGLSSLKKNSDNPLLQKTILEIIEHFKPR